MQTIGERLEEARKKKGVSIREAAEATKIRGDYLQKFESNQFDIGLTEIYTRGFLRTYASYLKVPADRVMNDYAALGRGDIRPRQPSREIYGRMDISVSTGGEVSDRAAPPPEESAAEAPATNRPQPRYPRGTGSSMPTGMDPVVLFKWLKIAGIIALAIVILLVIWALKPSGSSPSHGQAAAVTAPTAAPAIAPQPARDPTVTLIANNPMHVIVRRQNPDDTAGEILYEGSLNRGDTQIVPRVGPLYITSTLCQDLQIEVNGKRFGMGNLSGYATGRLPAPK